MGSPIDRPNNTGDNIHRPFVPPQEIDDVGRIAFALEFIATALARIDHNLWSMSNLQRANR